MVDKQRFYRCLLTREFDDHEMRKTELIPSFKDAQAVRFDAAFLKAFFIVLLVISTEELSFTGASTS